MHKPQNCGKVFSPVIQEANALVSQLVKCKKAICCCTVHILYNSDFPFICAYMGSFYHLVLWCPFVVSKCPFLERHLNLS